VQTSPNIPASRSKARAFTLVDLMVSIAVIGLLVGLLTPAVAAAKAAALRSACAANVRQLGLASQMFAYERGGRMPKSVFSLSSNTAFGYAPAQTVHLRVDKSSVAQSTTASSNANTSKLKEQWDGLGQLYKLELIEAPEVFYCPRATSEHTIDRYRPKFAGESGPIIGNYQLRLTDPLKYLSDLNPNMALIANSMRSVEEHSHKNGNNMLLADMSVQWFADGLRLMAYLHPIAGQATDRGGENPIEEAWGFLDKRMVPANASDAGGGRENLKADDQDKSKKASAAG